jgi:hypothetical protein
VMRTKDRAARLGNGCCKPSLSTHVVVWGIAVCIAAGTIVTAGAAIRHIAAFVAAGGVGTAEGVTRREAVPLEAAAGDAPATDKTTAVAPKPAADTSAVETSATTARIRGARPGRAGEGDCHDGHCHRQSVGHGTLRLNDTVRFSLGQATSYARTPLIAMR